MRKLLSLSLLLVVSLLLTGSAMASCTDASGDYCAWFGGGCTQLLSDLQLSETASCSAWVGSGWTSYPVINDPGDDYWEIQSWGGSVYQNYSIPSASVSMDVYAVVKVIKNSVGTERISVRIENTSGTLLQNLGTYYASSSGTSIVVNTSLTPYAGQTVRIRFDVAPGSSPGDTLFRLTQAYIRSYPY